jgi:hypothetical protein
VIVSNKFTFFVRIFNALGQYQTCTNCWANSRLISAKKGFLYLMMKASYTYNMKEKNINTNINFFAYIKNILMLVEILPSE